jgi:plastocyanin
MSATMGAAESGKNFRWSPSLETIAPGGTVTFAWSGGSAHDVSVAGIFESPKATTEASYPVAFPSAGEFTVRCIIHPAMVGKVVVK